MTVLFASLLPSVQLPNAASWSYFSLVLTVTIYLQFGRLLSIRNADLLGLFLFVPGFLLIQTADSDGDGVQQRTIGYIWLLSASAVWFVRCLFDLAAVRRPLFRANLSTPGLVWFGLTLYIGLLAAAINRPLADLPVGKPPVAITGVSVGAMSVVTQGEPIDADSYAAVRAWTERVLAMVGHAAVVIGLVVIGWRHYRDVETGFAMGTLYLLLPYTAFHIAQIHHVLPAALTVWAVVTYRRPWTTGMLLGVASGSAFFPALLFPVWLQLYWNRGAGRFTSGFLLAAFLGLAVTFGVLWAAGRLPTGINHALHLADWQPWKRPTAESLWQGVHWAYRMPVFVVFAVFAASTFFWPAIRTVSNAVAVSAALLIGVQFWFADRGGLYVLWYAPLLLMMVLRPTTVDLEPPTELPPGWGQRFAASVWRRVRGDQDRSQPPSLAA